MMNQTQMAAKLYDMRDTAKRFFREEYQEKLKPYSTLVNAHMKQNKKGAIEAAIDLCMLESFIENGMAQMMFFSAAVEIIEPSN